MIRDFHLKLPILEEVLEQEGERTSQIVFIEDVDVSKLDGRRFSYQIILSITELGLRWRYILDSIVPLVPQGPAVEHFFQFLTEHAKMEKRQSRIYSRRFQEGGDYG